MKGLDKVSIIKYERADYTYICIYIFKPKPDQNKFLYNMAYSGLEKMEDEFLLNSLHHQIPSDK